MFPGQGCAWCLAHGAGYEGKKKFVYLKWASHFWHSNQNFIFFHRTIFWFWVGGVVWPGGGVRHITPPPPPACPSVDKHIPGPGLPMWRPILAPIPLASFGARL